MSLPRMRTINEAYEYIMVLDSETSITKHLIRELCKQGKVRCFRTGTRYLLDIDDLCKKIEDITNL